MQKRILTIINQLYAEVPLYDMEAQPCTILADALGLQPIGARRAAAFYYLSLTADGWAAPRPEVRSHYAQDFTPTTGQVLPRVVGTGEACGFAIPGGRGRAIVLAAAYTCDVPFFRTVLETLGACAALRHDCPHYSIFLTTTAAPSGERFLHILNLDGFAKTIQLTEHDAPLLDGLPLQLERRAGLLLPLNVACGPVRIRYATAEVATEALTFRLTQPADVIALQTARPILPSDDYTIEQRGETAIITAPARRHRRPADRALALRARRPSMAARL